MDLRPGYQELPPPPALRGVLECLWVRLVSSDGAAGGPVRFDVLPDAGADLIWERGRGAFLAGPDTRPVPGTATPGSVMVGARFLPGAGGPALGVPLSELRNLRVDVADVTPWLEAKLPGTLSPEGALRRMAEMAARLVADGPPDRAVQAAARVLADPAARVRTLPEELGVSERQFRRRFDAAVGYGPKTLQRVLRFRDFLARLDASGRGADLATLAAESGYADQAHLTREVTRLAGTSPAALARSRASA
jgi:AraC-like DNA-binding protein